MCPSPEARGGGEGEERGGPSGARAAADFTPAWRPGENESPVIWPPENLECSYYEYQGIAMFKMSTHKYQGTTEHTGQMLAKHLTSPHRMKTRGWGKLVG